MERCRSGQGLMLAGVIVTLVGLGVVLMRTLAIPREWTPVLVGLGLLAAGAIRRAMSPGEGPPRA